MDALNLIDKPGSLDEILRRWLIQQALGYILDSYQESAKPGESLPSFLCRVFKYTANLFNQQYDFWKQIWKISANGCTKPD